ncbi:phosphodiesterase [Arthrobacter sp. ISL-30]|uniref:phosphodiesterase n=1 Tax=Arthrobacter sp. ISL-30 TaxID=2819109 RepID=UPI001BE5D17D|nr:phosphodiesterase [Arthrobacter sp. ISL-30]MBT2514173.1 phosphodiesterase [Arthrobacter sp. ISL-30]
MELIEAEHPQPRHTLLHISDPHIKGSSDPLYGAVDSEARLRQLFDEVHTSRVRPSAVVFTGDLADHGEPEAYAKLREIAEPACEAIGAEVIWTMGNHDDRANFRAGLFDEEGSDRPVDRSYYLDGLRVITLDTTVPGHHHGEVSQSQLDWLSSELATPAPDGTILALHHPPVPSVQDLAVLVELRGQAALAEVVGGTDIRSILGGHLHYSTSASFAGIPVSVASASCYTQDLSIPAGATRGRDAAQAFNLVHVYEHTIVHSVVPLGGGETVGRYVSPEETALRLAAAGIRIPKESNYEGSREAAAKQPELVDS